MLTACMPLYFLSAAPRRLRGLSTAGLAGVAAAVLPVPYLGRVVPDQEGQLLSQRHGAGQVREEIPDARPFVRMIMHG
jgi:hypothetical protein